MKTLNLIIMLTLVVSCQSVKKTADASAFDKAIAEHFDGKVKKLSNTSGTFIIVTQTNETSMKLPGNALKFGIYDVKKEKLVYIEEKYNAHASWFNEEYILIKSQPGVKSTDPEVDNSMRQYYINAKTLERFTQLPN
ncbi:hypothetical protein [Carboxylicivirga sp. RSCT41]|uniref:hypothetical protein n=1 Tax=Carboxylicivirga agarovorans TaxID=3417570 RepID=UPI003D335D75